MQNFFVSTYKSSEPPNFCDITSSWTDSCAGCDASCEWSCDASCADYCVENSENANGVVGNNCNECVGNCFDWSAIMWGK